MRAANYLKLGLARALVVYFREGYMKRLRYVACHERAHSGTGR